MAQDMYAPKSAFNIGYEQPLEAVEDRTEQISTDFQRMALRSEAKAINTEATVQRADFARKEAMLNIFSSGVSAFDSVLSANKAKRQDNLAKNFLSELDAIEQARESGEVSELKIQSMEGDLVRSALVSNLDFDKIKTEIELITDRPISMLGKSPEQYADSMMRNDPKYMIYTNASRLLNKGFSEQQHEEFAFDQIQMQQKNVAISDMAASRRKADEAITFNQFKAEDQPVIDDRFDTLVNSFIAGTERSSGIINREQVRSIKQAIQAEYTNLLSYKAVSGINSDDFQPFLDRVKGLEDTVDTILASTKADVYWEDFKSVISAHAKNGGDPKDMLVAMATGDTPTLAQALGLGDISERLNDLVNSDAVKKYYEPISSGQTLTDIQSNSDDIVNPNSVLDIDSLPEEFVQETMTPGDRSGASNKEKTKANYNNGLLYIENVDINKLQEENFQKQFITGATNLIRSLSTSDVAGSKERISEAIVSTDMLNKLNRLESYNKTAADTIRIGVRSQLSHQRIVNSKYLDNIENGAGRLSGYSITMTWDEGEKVYYINPADRPDQDKKGGIVRHLTELDSGYVRNNYVEGKGLRADPQQSRYFRGGVIEKALNARSSIEFIDKQFKLFEKADVEVPEPISSVRDITPLGESRVNLLNNDEIFKVVSDALDAADTSANTGMLSDAAVKQEVAKLLGLKTDETTTDTTVDADADEVQPDSGKEPTPVRDITPLGEGARDIEAEEYAEDMFKVSGTRVTPDIDKVKDFARDTYKNPVQAAAFVATVEAESGTGLVEKDYSKKRAIEVFVDRNRKDDGTLSQTMQKRKAAIEALPDNHTGDDIFDIVYEGRLGNRTGTNDGSRYKGRGLIQITGRDTYKKLGEKIGVDLLNNPELLETDKNIMLRATIAYLQDKDFSTSDLTESKLASIIGHSDDNNNTVAQTRWNSTKKVYKEMFGEELE